MRKTMVVLVMIASVLVVPAGMGFGYDTIEATGDLEVIAESLSDLFGKNIGSMTFLGDPVGYSTVPHFAVGVSGGVTLVPADNISAGSSAQLDLGGLSYLPIPAIGAVGKANIKGFELGVKVSGIPNIAVEGTRINSLILGGKVRYRLLDKKMVLVRLGASIGVFYEYATGNVSFVDQTTMPVMEDIDMDGNDEHVGDLTTTAGFDTKWSGSTVGAEAQANAKILFFNIFAGGRLSSSFGSSSTNLSGDSTLVSYHPSVSGGTISDLDINTEAGPSGLNTMVFGGVEFKILPINIVARGSYNFKNENITADLGARLQF